MIICFSYTKLNLNVISLILSILIVLSVNGILSSFTKVDLNAKIQGYYTDTNDFEKVIQKETEAIIDPLVWQIEIPKINLTASIAEGTTSNILDEFVGHFDETQKDIGNIGLAAHNRGYKVNYFERLKELEIGDDIIYTYKGTQRKYTVNFKSIIKDTDWQNLENTADNRITLITCVEDEPEYRRCIQGIEINN